MRVLYRKPDIYEKFEAAIAKAKEGKKHIDSFQISEEEFKEFIDLGIWNEKVKNNIIANRGSIQQLDLSMFPALTQHIKNKYKK